MKVKHHELVKIAQEFLKNYDMELNIPIEFNTRIKKIFGRFLFDRRDGKCVPKKIEMSVDFMMTHPREHIIDVFKHELVHYALCYKGLPFDDSDKVFKDELKKYNISRTHTYYYLGQVHEYECKLCGSVIERKRKLPDTAYCGCSNWPNLIYKGIVNRKLEENMVAYTGKGVCHKNY